MEAIMGGYRASEPYFKYHAAIVGKYNFTHHYYLVCSAGIISDFLLISAARCYVHAHNELKKFVFYAVVKTYLLKTKNIILNEIDKIYTNNYTHFGFNNDLAIARLKESLNREYRGNIAVLAIPGKEETFHSQTGFVSGFGISSFDELNKRSTREQIRLQSKLGQVLKYAEVLIMSDGLLGQFHHVDSNIYMCDKMVYPFTEICCIMLPDQTNTHRGICKGDTGSPLVVNNKVIGVVSIHNYNCDDTVHGTIYTKVTNHKDFIDAIMQGRTLNNTVIYQNPPYTFKHDTNSTGMNQFMDI